jgi:hypothetical protein
LLWWSKMFPSRSVQREESPLAAMAVRSFRLRVRIALSADQDLLDGRMRDFF